MGMHRYRAANMKEALRKVRRKLGGGAVIVEARERRGRTLLGLGPTRDWVEVKAARSIAEAEAGGSRWKRRRVDGGSPEMVSERMHAQVGEELGRLHALVAEISRHDRIDHLLPELPGELIPVYAKLVEADVPELMARRLLREVAALLEPGGAARPGSLREALREAVESCLPIAPPIVAVAGMRRVVALVGPTGVGKTTTVAKLAAAHKLSQGLRIGLVTADTYRIAAVEQLRTYADIIDLPLAVANEPGELRAALDSLGPIDLALIDTAGRGPRDELRIRELAEFFEQVRPDEVHLVLSATTGRPSLRAAVEKFGVLRADRLILTKVDEAEGLGAILAVIGQAGLPISYITTGQSVPDDFEPATRGRLARLILGEEWVF